MTPEQITHTSLDVFIYPFILFLGLLVRFTYVWIKEPWNHYLPDGAVGDILFDSDSCHLLIHDGSKWVRLHSVDDQLSINETLFPIEILKYSYQDQIKKK